MTIIYCLQFYHYKPMQQSIISLENITHPRIKTVSLRNNFDTLARQLYKLDLAYKQSG